MNDLPVAENSNERAMDRTKDMFGFKYAKHQVVNRLDNPYDWAVVREDKAPAPYKPDDELGFEDCRVVQMGHHSRHSAIGEVAKYNRQSDAQYGVRYY